MGANDDPAGRAWERRAPVWIEDLPGAVLPRGHAARPRGRAGLQSAAAFPVADHAGAVGAIELYSLRARPPEDAMRELMAEVGHEICEVFRRGEAQATALEAVARSRDELEQVLGALPDGITVLDGEGRIIFANDAAGRAFGFASGADMQRAARDEIVQRYQIWDEAGQRCRPKSCPASRRCAAGAARSWCATDRSTVSWNGGRRWRRCRSPTIAARSIAWSTSFTT